MISWEDIVYGIKRTTFLIIFRILSVCLTINGGKQVVPPINDPLLLMSATKLAALIREGKLKSETVIRSYIKRIQEVQPYINAMTYDRFEKALQEAKEVDEIVASGAKSPEEMAKETPLLGVPFTAKVFFGVKGMPQDAASLLFKGRIAKRDSKPVAALKKSGAICIGLSSVPELAVNFCGSNPISGTVKNPYDTRMGCCISSGGEAALCSSGASVIGLANDMGGSIRIPSALCCLFGHKATSGFTADVDIFPNPLPRVKPLISTGPICRYAEDLVTFMNVLLGPDSEQMKLDRKVDFSKVNIYYTHTLPKHFGVPPLEDEVLYAQLKVALYFKEKFGCTVKYVDLETIETFDAVARRSHSLVGGNTTARVLRENNCNINGSIEILKGLMGKSKLLTSTAITFSLAHMLHTNPRNFPKIEEKAKASQAEMESLLNENSVLLYPTYPMTHIHPLKGFFASGSIYITALATFLSLPATQCPVGMTDDGYPIGLQVIGGRYQDYLTLAFATEIEKAFGGWIPPNSGRSK